jgi:hypothetical protein
MYREGFPILYVSNIERSLRYYRDLLGFTVGYRWIPLAQRGTEHLCLPEIASAGVGASYGQRDWRWRETAIRAGELRALYLYGSDTLCLKAGACESKPDLTSLSPARATFPENV